MLHLSLNLVVFALSFLGGMLVYWLVLWSRKKAAITESCKIKDEAKRESEHIIREAQVTARADVVKLKEAFEEEAKERRKELAKIEQRLVQKEESLDKKLDLLNSRYDAIDKKEKELIQQKEKLVLKEKELQDKIELQIQELQKVASMDKETAKQMLLEKLENDIKQETGMLLKDTIEKTKETADIEAQHIIVSAIQRYASDCTYERTTATVPLPGDEMKGRIIGRDGRNIRSIEAETGVNLLIDDTPEAVVISCFDPIRKEIARQVIEKLVADGRIHPTRIEEIAKKVKKDIEKDIMTAGNDAVLEIGVQGLSQQIIKLLGRLKYRYSFSQNVLKHSLETAYFMGMIAAELGLDQHKAKRIGLLHDIGKAIDHEVEGTHASIGADILKKNGEDPEVINAVASHHGEVEQTSVYAVLVAACDALSASRPGARSESTELYLKRLEELEAIAKQFEGVESCYTLQAGREIRVIVQPEKISDEKALVLARDICLKVEKEVNYPGKIQVTVIRETRSIDYAK